MPMDKGFEEKAKAMFWDYDGWAEGMAISKEEVMTDVASEVGEWEWAPGWALIEAMINSVEWLVEQAPAEERLEAIKMILGV